MKETQKLFMELIEMHKILRGKKGCPWDKKQTIQSFGPFIEEEAMEVMQEIKKKDYPALKEELGDLLWNILFLCQIAKEENLFSLKEVLKTTKTKMKKRHPHVFGNKKTKNIKEIEKEWVKNKK